MEIKYFIYKSIILIMLLKSIKLKFKIQVNEDIVFYNPIV